MTQEDLAETDSTAIAIIGMSGRFPGANTVEDFWRNITEKKMSIEFFSDEELLEAGVDPEYLQRPDYVKAGTVLPDIDKFDAAFFGYTPREAEIMDPQQRVFLEVAWEAMEAAAYDTTTYQGIVGVFAGSGISTYMLHNILPHPEIIDLVGPLHTSLGNDKDSLTTRVSYKLNLRGPSISVQTYCSTSLVAVHLACQSLLNYECDMALAGGVAISIPQKSGYMYEEGGIVSPDGKCRTFDANAQGSVMGNGAGVVVLKRFDEALNDGDNIYAVIRGSAVNNDGRLRVSYTAPGLEGQSEVIAEALGHADIDVETLGYIEAHGTATELGDAVELAAMMKAFETKTQKKQFCAIGSVKPNVGHLDRASGVTGLIKTALALQQKQLPPSLNFEDTSSDIDLANSPFYVNTQLRNWETDSGIPRRAGVSSFGLGGTNAHVVLEEAPQRVPSSPSRPLQLFLLSAKTETALQAATRKLAAHLKKHENLSLPDVAYTLQTGRDVFAYRRAIICHDTPEAIAALESENAESVQDPFRDRPVTFLFPGLGEQYIGVAQELYAQEPTFRESIMYAGNFLKTHFQLDILEILALNEKSVVSSPKTGGFSGKNNEPHGTASLDLRALLGRNGTNDEHAAHKDSSSALSERLKQTEVAQPILFVIEYALAQLLIRWGIRPSAMLGYSLGEYVAACLSGVFTLEDALTLVASRARLLQATSPGAMVAVPLSAKDVHAYLGEDISLAAINGPETCILSGPVQAIERLERLLAIQNMVCRRVETMHAFHSSMLESLREPLIDLVRNVHLNPPKIPYISNVTGTWITNEQATSPEYWADHICQTVQFANGVAQLLANPDMLLLEVGPGQTLCSFVKQHTHRVRGRSSLVFPTLPSTYSRQSNQEFLLTTLSKLWLAGVTIDWTGFYTSERRYRVPLPAYPFDRQRYWIDAPRPTAIATPSSPSVDRSLAGKKPDPADWFYAPVWHTCPTETTDHPHPHSALTGPWLILLDQPGVGEHIANWLEQQGQQVVYVKSDTHFAQSDPYHYQLTPGKYEEFVALSESLQRNGLIPRRILFAWSYGQAYVPTPSRTSIQESQEYGLYSLLWLIQTLEKNQGGVQRDLFMVLDGVHAIQGNEELHPEHSPLLTVCQMLTQEYLNIHSRIIELEIGEQAADTLRSELEKKQTGDLVAYRDGVRYVAAYESKRLEPVKEASSLREKGVYLITGGLGGVGLVLAEHLARTVQARLVLLGRTGLPERETWAEWIEQHETDEPISQQIQRVQALEKLGAQVLVLRVDVSDQMQLHRAFARIDECFGTLHGVIHAAGISNEEAFGSIQNTGREAVESHFGPKVYGLLALEEALAGKKLDFCLFFSSLSAILGGLGLAAYAAANAFIDAYIYQHNRISALPWQSVNWDIWHVKENAHGVLGASIARFEMKPHEAVNAFERVIANQHLTQLINSTGDLDARIRQWVLLEGLQDDLALEQEAISHLSSPSTGGVKLARSDYEQKITEVWKEVLGVGQIGLRENFFDVGGNSLTGLQLLSRIKKVFHIQVPVTVLFEAPTIGALAAYLCPADTIEVRSEQDAISERRARARQQKEREPIAIIGMSGRFPGASSIEEFWQNLRNGVESVSFFTDEELIEAGVDPQVFQQADYVRVRPILDDVEHFDAAFFGYSPREAELLDPQHRLFLECSWEALENAGYDSLSYEGLIGVFGGTNVSSYMINLLSQPEVLGNAGDYLVTVSSDKDSLATGVSYKLNLRGPSFSVQTFCSTSLVAVHLGCQSLLNGECDLALAGGVSVRVPVKAGYLYQPGDQESADGHCRTFDARAQGTSFGDGVGIVILKRLSEALADGDTIYAVIKGSAVNNDGSLKVSYSAPSVVGQADAVSAALEVAGLHPESIGYIEAHGTATKLGDPIEVASLTRAFRRYTQQVGYCAIGSVKTNIGHLDRASGVSGLIKTALAVKHGELPASLHFESPNPEIDFANSPFFVNTRLRPWPESQGPRRAGVNSLGMGGTNAHVIVEEPPMLQTSDPSRPWNILPLSARTSGALQQMKRNLLNYLRDHPQTVLADVAFTLQRGRRRFDHRYCIMARDPQEACELLASEQEGQQQWNRTDSEQERGVALLWDGESEHYVGLSQELYEREPLFQQIVDDCCQRVSPWLHCDLRALLYPLLSSTSALKHGQRTSPGRSFSEYETPQSEQLKSTHYAQPALFIIEYAIARLLLSWGIRPQALIGYGSGEYIAACLADVFSLNDALWLVCERARLIEAQAPDAPIEPLRLALTELVSQVTRHAPRIPCFSNASGKWLTEQEAIDEDYWGQHLSHPVRFSAGIETLWEQNQPVIIEIAPGQSSGTLVKEYVYGQTEVAVLSTLRESNEQQSEQRSLLETLGKLWLAGASVGWRQFWAEERRQRLPLPTYPFERQRYWLSPKKGQHGRATIAAQPLSMIEAIVGNELERKPDIADWFYLPSWKQSVPTLPFETSTAHRKRHCWLLFADECGLSQQIKAQLENAQQKVILLVAGQSFEKLAEDTYSLHPTTPGDYTILLQRLLDQGETPNRIVHAWSVTEDEKTQRGERDFALHMLEVGFHSLLALTQALGNSGIENCEISILSNHVQDVTGSDWLCPTKATVIGPCRVISQEYATIRCRSIDIALGSPGSCIEQVAAHIVGEITAAEWSDLMVAFRGRHRWVQTFEPIRLRGKEERVPTLRSGGVYILLGGLGGIGLAIAHHLAETAQAKLVLTSRSGLPPEESWDSILQKQGDAEGIGRQIRQIQTLKEKGTQVLVLAADITDQQQMQQVIEQTTTAFGTINGVIHMAAVPPSGLIQLKTPAMATSVLAPKVQGTFVLEDVLRPLSLDFLVFFSSISAATGGGPGQVDYCAANAFLDAYARQNFSHHTMTIAIDWGEWQWDAWQGGLLGFPEEAQVYFKERRRKFGIDFPDGIEAFSRILARRLPQICVATQDFSAMVEGSKHFSISQIIQKLQEYRRMQGAAYPRPALNTPYVAPEGELEQIICAFWTEILGIEQIGVQDNFFELGGHSLMGTQLISRIRQRFQVTLPLSELFESPTIEALSLVIEEILIAEIEKADGESISSF